MNFKIRSKHIVKYLLSFFPLDNLKITAKLLVIYKNKYETISKLSPDLASNEIISLKSCDNDNYFKENTKLLNINSLLIIIIEIMSSKMNINQYRDKLDDDKNTIFNINSNIYKEYNTNNIKDPYKITYLQKLSSKSIYCFCLLEAYDNKVLSLVGNFDSVEFFKLNNNNNFMYESNKSIENNDSNTALKTKYKYFFDNIDKYRVDIEGANEFIKEIIINNSSNTDKRNFLIVCSRKYTISVIDLISMKIFNQISTMSDYCKIICSVDFNQSYRKNLNDKLLKENEFVFASGFAKTDKSVKIYKIEYKVNNIIQENNEKSNNKDSFFINNEDHIEYNTQQFITLTRHEKTVYSLFYYSKYNILISSGYDSLLILWDIFSKRIIHFFNLDIYYNEKPSFASFITSSNLNNDIIYLGLNKKRGFACLNFSTVFKNKSNTILTDDILSNTLNNYLEKNETISNNDKEFMRLNLIYYQRNKIDKIIKKTIWGINEIEMNDFIDYTNKDLYVLLFGKESSTHLMKIKFNKESEKSISLNNNIITYFRKTDSNSYEVINSDKNSTEYNDTDFNKDKLSGNITSSYDIDIIHVNKINLNDLLKKYTSLNNINISLSDIKEIDNINEINFSHNSIIRVIDSENFNDSKVKFNIDDKISNILVAKPKFNKIFFVNNKGYIFILEIY